MLRCRLGPALLIIWAFAGGVLGCASRSPERVQAKPVAKTKAVDLGLPEGLRFPFPPAADYEYRPSSVDRQAAANSYAAPAWLVLRRIFADEKGEKSRNDYQEEWAKASPEERLRLLPGQAELSEAQQLWGIEQELGCNLRIPRNVSLADIKGESAPQWIRAELEFTRHAAAESLLDESTWAKTPYAKRRSVLESITEKSGRSLYQVWLKANAETIARFLALGPRQGGPALIAPDLRFQDVASNLPAYGGKKVWVRAHWQKELGRAIYIDQLAESAVAKILISPRGESRPTMRVGLDWDRYTSRKSYYEGLEPKAELELGAKVRVLLYVSGLPLAEETPCVARVLRVEVEVE